MEGIISVLLGYLIGSISFSYLIARKIMKIDIRKHGSGNAGATNTLRVLGIGPAITVLLLDTAKGVVAVLIGFGISDANWVPFAAGMAAIIGHNWPIYYGFRGGKGVATTIGVFATLAFPPALIAGVIAILTIVITRYVSLGSILFMIATPILTLFIGSYPLDYTILASIIAILAIWRHRANIQRLVKGTESKIGQKKEVS
jgi:acyl phosphate:glycerol-3-phosphate acyltransferase